MTCEEFVATTAEYAKRYRQAVRDFLDGKAANRDGKFIHDYDAECQAILRESYRLAFPQDTPGSCC